MTFDVFLSHDSQDFDLVDRVWKILDRINISAYMYEFYPNYGQYLPETIKAMLKQSKCVVVFFTRNGMNSQWVNQEVGIAIGSVPAFQSITIPVVEEGVICKGFTEHLIHINYKVNQPEIMLANLVWALRQKLGKANLVSNGLRVDCTCGWIFQSDLWALETINILLERGHNFYLCNCPQCGAECKFDLRTWENVL